MTYNYQHNSWINFGDSSPDYGQTWILDAFVDNTQDYAECVKVMSGVELFGPSNIYIIERGSIYMPLDDADKVASALGVIGMTPSLATWIDKALAFDAYHGMDRDTWGGLEVVSIGKILDQNALESFPYDIDAQLHGNASISKYLRDNYLT